MRRLVELGQVDFGLGFDDEDGVGGRVTGGLEFLEGVIERIGENREKHASVFTPNEIEATFGLDELE